MSLTIFLWLVKKSKEGNKSRLKVHEIKDHGHMPSIKQY